jgi:hypothetical protein
MVKCYLPFGPIVTKDSEQHDQDFALVVTILHQSQFDLTHGCRSVESRYLARQIRRAIHMSRA